ncbi:hypothetical protein [Caballeronia sp. AZ1_KS37]|nr:hypothetical protein [Caballeronia sp. AZ1_KS37]
MDAPHTAAADITTERLLQVLQETLEDFVELRQMIDELQGSQG